MPDQVHQSPPPVYFGGNVTTADRVRLPADDRGVLFGLGFFETFRTSAGCAHHWAYHQRRLLRACATAGFSLPAGFLGRDEPRLIAMVRALLTAVDAADAVFRYTVTAGPGPGRDCAGPAEWLTLRALPAAAPDSGVTLRVLKLGRDNGEWVPRPKSLNYANALLGRAELEQRASHPADEGLFLARDSALVVEATRHNVAWIRDDCLCFPDSALGAVAGTCLAWLQEQEPAAVPRRAPLDELVGADAVVICNSVRGITPVGEIRGRQDELLRGVLNSADHPRVRALRQRWRDALAATAAGHHPKDRIDVSRDR